VKSGTNQIHGSAFEYNFNNEMIARPFFLPVNQPNPKSILNNFGGTAGGPIVKNRLFYFVSYDANLTRLCRRRPFALEMNPDLRLRSTIPRPGRPAALAARLLRATSLRPVA
jgi:hypothetical protein